MCTVVAEGPVARPDADVDEPALVDTLGTELVEPPIEVPDEPLAVDTGDVPVDPDNGFDDDPDDNPDNGFDDDPDDNPDNGFDDDPVKLGVPPWLCVEPLPLALTVAWVRRIGWFEGRCPPRRPGRVPASADATTRAPPAAAIPATGAGSRRLVMADDDASLGRCVRPTVLSLPRDGGCRGNHRGPPGGTRHRNEHGRPFARPAPGSPTSSLRRSPWEPSRAANLARWGRVE
ncbi:hypothetical protein [Aciditerrimonas ferrireducens]|uniref:hypothetical protein n=1 Tax=Aciditerrimonas ferrireducens TaxID=667306 RepID=UPI002005C87D|nr:hypothetical protein [Aciditerrimonas ferrireducens]MCK4176359.1 hypothetical protein [Aciditerrimonas ferrireducens]